MYPEGGQPTSKARDFVPDLNKLAVFWVEPYASAFEPIREKFALDKSIQMGEGFSPTEAMSMAKKTGASLILCYAKEEEDISRVTAILKGIDAAGKMQQTHVVVVTGFAISESLRSKLNVFGCSEMLSEPISEKSLQFKLEIHIRTLRQNLEENAPEERKRSSEGSAESAAQNQTKRFGPPLELESDCWITLRGGIRKVGGRWSVQMKGPPPEAGTWERIPRALGTEPQWEWMPADPDQDIFIREEGNWRFTGQKPEYLHGAWVFTGKTADLSFFYSGESYGSKFNVDEAGALLLAADSPAAIRALSVIEELEAKKNKKNEKAEEKGISASVPEIKAAESECRWVDPLELEEDFWRTSSKPRMANGGWMIKLFGPGPEIGRWVEAPEGEGGEPRWKWKSEALDSGSKGNWIFSGMRPKFQGEEWFFFGKRPELSFYRGTEKLGTRFTVNDSGSLVISRNRKDSAQVVAALKAKAMAARESGSAHATEHVVMKVAEPSFVLGPSLEIASDCWVLEGRKPRWVTGGWMVKLLGPGPTAGKWVQIALEDTGSGGATEGYWNWVPTDYANDPFIKEEGAWVFRGRMPKFQDGEWIFFAARPELGFFYEGESFGNKLGVDESGAMVVAADSEQAQKLLPLLEKSAAGLLPAGGAEKKKSAIDPSELKAEPEVKFTNPIELESDFWLLENRKPRWLSGKWMIKLAGPGTKDGGWERIEGEGLEEAWQWMPKGPIGESFLKEEGAWVFRGSEPKFQDGEWLFFGTRPELSFYYEGEAYGRRIYCDDYGRLILAVDSESALQAKPSIEASAEGILAVQAAQPEILAAEPAGAPIIEEAEPAAPVATPEIEVAIAPEAASGSAAPKPVFRGKGPQIQYVDPLELESDCWVLSSAKPRFINHGWLVRLKGPGPMVGRWQRRADEASQEFWQWIPKDPDDDIFIKEEGAWIFKGQEPKFENTEWIFFSTNPELAFYYEGESYGAKLALDSSGALNIALDSTAAADALPDIEKSSEDVLVAKKTEVFAFPPPREEVKSEAGFEPILPDEMLVGKKEKVFGEPVQAAVPESVSIIESAEPVMAEISSANAYPIEPPMEMVSRGAELPELPPELGILSPSSSQGSVQAVVAEKPLSPIALAFLMSELICKKDLTYAAAAQRFCAYLAVAFGKKRTELWFSQKGEWVCAATFDGFDPALKDHLKDLKKHASVNDRGVTLVPVNREIGDDSGATGCVGVLLIDAGGSETQRVDGDLAVAAGEMLRGVLIAFDQLGVPQKEQSVAAA